MSSQRLMIKNGTIVTNGEPNEVLHGYGLVIAGTTIETIAPMSYFKEETFDEVIDAQGQVILPGFVNAHMHTYSSFACGLGKAEPSKNFVEVLENLWWRLDKQLTLDDVHASAQLACIAAIRAGTTTFIDHHASPGAVRGSLDAIARAVKETGLRAALCYEVSDRDGEEVAQQGLAENSAFLQRLKDEPDPQLAGLFGLHAAFTVGDKTMAQAAEAAASFGVGCHIHVAEASSDQTHSLKHYGKPVIQRLKEAGILGEHTICAHCVHVDEEEVEILAETGSIVTHQPQSNMNNAVGTMDLISMEREGVTLGLGTDAMTQNMLEEMRVALWQQKLHHREPSGAFMEVTSLLMDKNPAIANRFFSEKVGKLSPGYAADICIMDYRPHTPMDADNFLGHLVFGLSQASVDTTIASGKVLMRHHKLTTLDEEAICARAQSLADALWKRF